jgi:hypothetical protein
MRSRLSRLVPKPSVVLPVIAIFFAIGGIGYAAATVGTSDIKNGAVTKKKLHKNAVISKKVKNHSLKCLDMRFNCPVAGPTGPRGATGPAGAGLNNLVIVPPVNLTNGGSHVMASSGPLTITATCDINSGGQDVAKQLISTTQNNASFDAWDELEDLDTGTPATSRDFGPPISVATGSSEIEANVDDGVAISADGHFIHLVSTMSAVNLPSAPAGTCTFSGSFVVG